MPPPRRRRATRYIALAATQFAIIAAGAFAVGPVDAGGLTRTGLTLLVTAWVVGWVMASLRSSDASRREAEEALVAEREARARAEERAKLAAQLHDSAVQTLVVLRQQADDPEQVRALARRQERELRSLTRDEPSSGGLVAGLGVVANDIEDLHALHVERVFLGDAPSGASVDALVQAAREALVNVAKHAAVDKAHLFAEVADGTATVSVRDRGTGFDVHAVGDDRGLTRSIRDRIAAVGGTVALRSVPGQGTDVEMEVPLT